MGIENKLDPAFPDVICEFCPQLYTGSCKAFLIASSNVEYQSRSQLGGVGLCHERSLGKLKIPKVFETAEVVRIRSKAIEFKEGDSLLVVVFTVEGKVMHGVTYGPEKGHKPYQSREEMEKVLGDLLPFVAEKVTKTDQEITYERKLAKEEWYKVR